MSPYFTPLQYSFHAGHFASVERQHSISLKKCLLVHLRLSRDVLHKEVSPTYAIYTRHLAQQYKFLTVLHHPQTGLKLTKQFTMMPINTVVTHNPSRANMIPSMSRTNNRPKPYSDQESSSGILTQNPQLAKYLGSPAAMMSSGGNQSSSENYAPTADELPSQGYALVPVKLNPREIRAGYYTAEELELIQSLLGDTSSVYAPRIAYESEECGQTSGEQDAETVETEYPSDMEYPAHLDRWRDEEDDYYTSSSEGMCCVLKLSLGTS